MACFKPQWNFRLLFFHCRRCSVSGRIIVIVFMSFYFSINSESAVAKVVSIVCFERLLQITYNGTLKYGYHIVDKLSRVIMRPKFSYQQSIVNEQLCIIVSWATSAINRWSKQTSRHIARFAYYRTETRVQFAVKLARR